MAAIKKGAKVQESRDFSNCNAFLVSNLRDVYVCGLQQAGQRE
jgi:hypothetical protein